MIEYALKPLWDPKIPLELFMTKGEAVNFREYLYNATVTQLASGNSCADAYGDCYGNGGICLPKYDPETGTYEFVCENPTRQGQLGTYEYDVYVFGLETGEYHGKNPDSKTPYPNWWGHHTPVLATGKVANLPNGAIVPIPRQQGIFGYNQVNVYDRNEHLGTCK